MRALRAQIIGLGIAAACAASASAQVAGYYGIRQGAPGQLATRPPYPYGRADDVRRPGFNGRLWVGRPIIGGVDTGYAYGWDDPGPSAYGAPEDDASVAYVRIGCTSAAVSPWETVRGTGLHDLEAGRQKWLDEQGYTGGVRTFVNDLYLYKPAAEAAEPEKSASAQPSAAPGVVTPRATIHVPIDTPRFKARMHVKNDRAKGAAAVALLGNSTPIHMHAPNGSTARADTLIRVLPKEDGVTQTSSRGQTEAGAALSTPVASAER